MFSRAPSWSRKSNRARISSGLGVKSRSYYDVLHIFASEKFRDRHSRHARRREIAARAMQRMQGTRAAFSGENNSLLHLVSRSGEKSRKREPSRLFRWTQIRNGDESHLRTNRPEIRLRFFVRTAPSFETESRPGRKAPRANRVYIEFTVRKAMT